MIIKSNWEQIKDLLFEEWQNSLELSSKAAREDDVILSNTEKRLQDVLQKVLLTMRELETKPVMRGSDD